MTKDTAAETPDEIVILNTEGRTFTTTRGPLLPGKSISLPEGEAKSLLMYKGIKDASKIVPQTAETINGLKSENSKLRKQVADLQAENEAFKAASVADDEEEIEEDEVDETTGAVKKVKKKVKKGSKGK